MFSVQPHGTVKAGFDLVDAAGRTVGALSGTAWREGGPAARWRRDSTAAGAS